MGKKIDPEDIVGSKYNKLEVVEYLGRDEGHHSYRCICDCGRETVVERNHIITGHTKSCGCIKKEVIDGEEIVGQRFGTLTVVEYLGIYAPSDGTKPLSMHKCICDCGNIVNVRRSALISGHTRSCGNCNAPHIEQADGFFRYVCRDNQEFLFDPEDYELAESHTWQISPYGYAVTSGEEKSFARFVMKPGEGQDVDHINGNRRDNRRSNLRIAERCENIWNTRITERNSTGYKGVYPDKKEPKYHARICEHGRRHYLGYFVTPEEAARAYDEAARFYFGEFACLNFPLPGEQGCRRNEEREKLSA